MNTRFGRAFRYEVRNYFRAVAILWLVMALIPAAMLAITYFLAGETAMEVSFNGYSIAVGMFGLVLGMVGLRENQRVLNQNGVSRRSAFLADVAALAVAAVLGLHTTGVLVLIQKKLVLLVTEEPVAVLVVVVNQVQVLTPLPELVAVVAAAVSVI